MKLPDMPIPYVCIHTHEFPENAPYGWGTAFNHFNRKYDDIPGMLEEHTIPTNVEFWTKEVEQCKKNLKIAVEIGKGVEKAFDQLSVASNRLTKEKALSK